MIINSFSNLIQTTRSAYLSLQQADGSGKRAVGLFGSHVVLADQFALERSPLWVRNRLEHVVTVQALHPLAFLIDRDELFHVQRNIHSNREVPLAVAQIHDFDES